MAAHAQPLLLPALPCAPSQLVATPVARLEHRYAQHRRRDLPGTDAAGAAPFEPLSLDCSEAMEDDAEPILDAAALPPLPPLRPVAGSQLRGQLGEPACRPGVYTFGCPIGSLVRGPATDTAMTSPKGTPRCSILNARFETPAPPLGALSPRALSAMRPGGPTGVKLCGAVRIRGDAITPLHTATPPAPIHAAAAPAAPGRTERIPTPPPPELAVAAIVSAATKRARLVAPPPAPKPAASGQCSANCAPAMPPLAASNRVATSPQRPPASPARPPRSALRAQMEMTPPRKRARKSAAPLRAAASSEEAVEGAGTPASLRKQGSFSGETDDSGDVPLAATPLLPAVPSKAMRRF